jgi:hypothetical protein
MSTTRNSCTLPANDPPEPSPRSQHSLPSALKYLENSWNTQEILREVNALTFKKTPDVNYIPQVIEDSSSGDSSVSFTASRNSSSYDPLHNLEEYLKMRDQL